MLATRRTRQYTSRVFSAAGNYPEQGGRAGTAVHFTCHFLNQHEVSLMSNTSISSRASSRGANMGAMLRVLQPLTAGSPDPERRRQLVADFCRLLGAHAGIENAGSDLPPRLKQTLMSLLSGASEKQIAQTMELSPHTIHVYVKQIYRHYNVSSRGELLARWVKR